MSTIDRYTFVRAVLDLYLGLPHAAAPRPSRNDHRLAEQLFDRAVSLDIVRTAMLLAMARRSARPSDAPPLSPIRSLSYFIPILDELLASPLDPSYMQYLNFRYQHLLYRPSGQISTVPHGQ